MQFISPRTDFAFKKIFGSEQSKDVLISFLNAILALEGECRIVDVTIIDPYLAPLVFGMKLSCLDVRARDQRGVSYIIEMQVLDVEGFEKRVLYNTCKAYSTQLNSGEKYHLLDDVIAITITNFTLFNELPDFVNSFKLRHASGYNYGNQIELVFGELTKFNKTEAELNSIIDRWFYFLKHADDLNVIPDSLGAEPAIRHAFSIANRAQLTSVEEEELTRAEMYLQDQRGAVSLALKKGEQQGLEEGLAKGEEIGIAKGLAKGEEIGYTRGLQASAQQAEQARLTERLQIARGLLDLVSDNDLLAAKTGLSSEQIQALRESPTHTE